MKNFIIEGLDRLGKDTLIKNIQHKTGYKMVCHRSKPLALDCYRKENNSLLRFQHECFVNDMRLLWMSEDTSAFDGVIFNRSWLGEFVYAPMYRGYSAEYIFDYENAYSLEKLKQTTLVLLTEDFSKSKHFVDDGLSFDISKRVEEQNSFELAFERSRIPCKKKISVTADNGSFKDPLSILSEVFV